MTSGIIYCRVSSLLQVGDDHISLDVQEARCREWAVDKGIKIRQVFKDEGKSGTTLRGRMALKEALENLQPKEIFIVYDLSRLARSMEDGMSIIDQIREKGGDFRSISQNFDPDDPQGKFFLSTMLSFSELEVGMTRRKIKDAIGKLRDDGMVFGRIPFGKKRAPDGHHMIDDEEELIIIENIFNLRLVKKLTFRKIARYFNERQIHSPADKVAKKHDRLKSWTSENVEYLYNLHRGKYEEKYRLRAEDAIDEWERIKKKISNRRQELLTNRLDQDTIDMIIKKEFPDFDKREKKIRSSARIQELRKIQLSTDVIRKIIKKELDISYDDIVNDPEERTNRRKAQRELAIRKYRELKKSRTDLEKIGVEIDIEFGIDIRDIIREDRIRSREKELSAFEVHPSVIETIVLKEFPPIDVRHETFEEEVHRRISILEDLKVDRKIIKTTIEEEFGVRINSDLSSDDLGEIINPTFDLKKHESKRTEIARRLRELKLYGVSDEFFDEILASEFP